MNSTAIIAEITDQADEFLVAVTDRELARTAIAELIERDYFELTPSDRSTVIDSIMSALEAEEHFGIEFVGDPFKDDPAAESEGDE